MLSRCYRIYCPDEPVYAYPKHLNRFNKEINENHDAFSSFILGLKEQYEFFIQHFYNRIKPKLSDKEFVIVVVPPHTQGNGCNTGIGILARRLSGGNIIDGTKSLYRHKEINKLSSGGDREEIIHMRSIRVENEDLIKNKHVLLLDDIITTGNSMSACQKLLKRAGAKTVKCYSLGKTTRTEHYKQNEESALAISIVKEVIDNDINMFL